MTRSTPGPKVDPNMPVDEALRRYREAFAHVSRGRMHWNGTLLRIDHGNDYVHAFEQLQASRAAARRPWTPGDRA